jgi:hypothetical protein
MSKSKAYNISLALCLSHAALLSITPWVQIGPNTVAFNKAFYDVWGIFLSIWPLWLIALVILWRLGDRKWWRLLVAFGLGLVLLIPALLFIDVMVFGH